MPESQRATQHPITQDIPLPGNYPCLTLQLNVTMYAAPVTMRMVLSVREPSDHIEIYRASIPTTDWGVDTADGLCFELRQAIANAQYMQHGTND